MPTFQLLSALINLAGDRGNVVARDGAEAITYPEALVLQAIHGGEEHVHELVVVGTTERDMASEHERLLNIYGDVVEKVFPRVGGMLNLPAENPALPTAEEVAAAQKAAADAAATVRATRAASTSKAKAQKPAPAPAPEPEPLPDLPGGMPDLLAAK